MANKFKEKALEQWAVDNFDEFSMSFKYGKHSAVELIGTQISCPVGIIDMLAADERAIFVIEFKAVRATEEHVGQLMRYVGCIREAVCGEFYNRLKRHWSPIHSETFVTPVLVAPSFEKKAMLGCCDLVQASFDGMDFVCETARCGLSSHIGLSEFDELQKLLQPHVDAWAMSMSLVQSMDDLKNTSLLWRN